MCPTFEGLTKLAPFLNLHAEPDQNRSQFSSRSMRFSHEIIFHVYTETVKGQQNGLSKNYQPVKN